MKHKIFKTKKQLVFVLLFILFFFLGLGAIIKINAYNNSLKKEQIVGDGNPIQVYSANHDLQVKQLTKADTSKILCHPNLKIDWVLSTVDASKYTSVLEENHEIKLTTSLSFKKELYLKIKSETKKVNSDGTLSVINDQPFDVIILYNDTGEPNLQITNLQSYLKNPTPIITPNKPIQVHIAIQLKPDSSTQTEIFNNKYQTTIIYEVVDNQGKEISSELNAAENTYLQRLSKAVTSTSNVVSNAIQGAVSWLSSWWS